MDQFRVDMVEQWCMEIRTMEAAICFFWVKSHVPAAHIEKRDL
jgi:hypothetical protein